MSKKPKPIITDEHRKECRALREIWDKTPNRLTQVEFGEKFNIGSQAAVGHFLRGTSAISLKAAKGFAAGLGCRISDFSPRLAALETAWPFELVDRACYDALSAAMRHKAQVRFDDYIKELLAEAATNNSPAKVSPEYQDELNQMTQAAEARREHENKQRPHIPRDGTTGH
jgi:hypothetical protein